MMPSPPPADRATLGPTRPRGKDAPMVARRRRPSRWPAGLLPALLIGMVVIPTVLSLTVGIVALAVWREAFDLVFGVLILTFGATAIAGGTAAIGFVRRNARLAELQADFVANVSHELRTPLAGIRLVTETLEAGRGDDPARLAVLTEMLGDEVRRLEDLIERVLAWRHAASAATTPYALVAPGPLLRAAAADLARLPEARGVTLAVDAPDDLPPVWGDPALLAHAVRNLVHNALKFGGAHGPVRVSARTDGAHVLLAVRDEGPGIPPLEHQRIFERFYRSAAPGVRGTGLGLDIVRTVVEDHGGTVTVDSAPGRGATFTLRLPLAPGQPPAPREAAP